MSKTYPVVLFPNYYQEIQRKKINYEDVFPDTPKPKKSSANTLTDYLAEKENSKQYRYAHKCEEENGYKYSTYLSEDLTTGDKIIMNIIFILFIVVVVLIGLLPIVPSGLSLFNFCASIFLGYCFKDGIAQNVKSKNIRSQREAAEIRNKIIREKCHMMSVQIKLTATEIEVFTQEFYKMQREYSIAEETYSMNLSSFNNQSFPIDYKLKKMIIEAEHVKKRILEKSKIITKDAPKKGIAEEFFSDFLKNANEFIVYKSLKIDYYYPDITLLHEETNVLIDIEIDEPYSFEDRIPIHHGDMDDNRDKYFAENGFFVIRFSENQIINETLKCYNLIKDCISKIKLLDSNIEFYSNNSNIKHIKCTAWNYEEAFNMAYEHTRKDIPDIIKQKRKLLNI